MLADLKNWMVSRPLASLASITNKRTWEQLLARPDYLSEWTGSQHQGRG